MSEKREGGVMAAAPHTEEEMGGLEFVVVVFLCTVSRILTCLTTLTLFSSLRLSLKYS